MAPKLKRPDGLTFDAFINILLQMLSSYLFFVNKKTLPALVVFNEEVAGAGLLRGKPSQAPFFWVPSDQASLYRHERCRYD